MTLQPGCRFAVAPHFHRPADWHRRLFVGTGVDEGDGQFVPRHEWRPPTDDELSVLVRTANGPLTPEELSASVCLFQLPGHLGVEWWSLLDRSAEALAGGRLPDFDSFASQVVEFLAFKELPLPDGARCDVVVSDPAQRLVPWGPGANRSDGLRCNVEADAPWPWPKERDWPQLWGGINLGDEDTSVVLMNLTCRQIDAEMRQRLPDQPTPRTVGELAQRFLHSQADYPPVRLTLGPGEGFRLPNDGLILGGYLADKQETDIFLSISHGSRPAT